MTGPKAKPSEKLPPPPAAKNGPTKQQNGAAKNQAATQTAKNGDEALTGFLTNLDEESSASVSAPAKQAPAPAKPNSATTYRAPEPMPPWVWVVGGAIVLAVFLLGVWGYQSSQDAKRREKEAPKQTRSFQRVEWTPEKK